jgi:beta-glucosidase
MALDFGKDFLFGAATAAYQIEGGWNEDGKGRSIWDVFSHTKGKIRDGATGDVACGTYHDFQTDVEIMAALGLNAYRFSVSWSRVMPEGRGKVNEKGLDYYSRLVDALLEKGIRPFITLFHWDTPEALFRQYGGFAGRETASCFADYSALVVKRLGDRVKDWITLNEPWEHAMFGHFLGEHAPGIRNPWTYFKVAHHELLGHGLAVQAIRAARGGMNVGITLSQFPVYPARFEPKGKDMDSVELADEFINRFYLDGVFRGRYPENLFRRLWPIVPKVKPGDMETIVQPIDFLGVNYYSRIFAARKWYIPFLRTWVDRAPTDHRYDHPVLGPQGYPEGFLELAKRYRKEYGNPVVYITENGTVGGELRDANRIEYTRLYLEALRTAIDQGADIRGYFHWTLIDNFEWSSGLSCPMGLVQVEHSTQKRTVRDSGYWYRDLIAGQGKEAR